MIYVIRGYTLSVALLTLFDSHILKNGNPQTDPQVSAGLTSPPLSRNFDTVMTSVSQMSSQIKTAPVAFSLWDDCPGRQRLAASSDVFASIALPDRPAVYIFPTQTLAITNSHLKRTRAKRFDFGPSRIRSTSRRSRLYLQKSKMPKSLSTLHFHAQPLDCTFPTVRFSRKLRDPSPTVYLECAKVSGINVDCSLFSRNPRVNPSWPLFHSIPASDRSVQRRTRTIVAQSSHINVTAKNGRKLLTFSSFRTVPPKSAFLNILNSHNNTNSPRVCPLFVTFVCFCSTPWLSRVVPLVPPENARLCSKDASYTNYSTSVVKRIWNYKPVDTSSFRMATAAKRLQNCNALESVWLAPFWHCSA
jgi:hypothetical protein